MVTEERNQRTEFERCVAALLAGDTAFVFTFVERCGPIVASILAKRGVPPVDRQRLVEEIALGLLNRGHDAGDPIAVVAAVAAEVASEPEAGAFERASTCGSDAVPRTLHLIDIENLAGNPRICDAWFNTTLRAYVALVGLAESDLVLMAANPHLWSATAWLVPDGFSYRPAPGADGADLNLLSRAPADWVSRRFERVVIGSGDGIFAPLANELNEAGLAVDLVSQPDLLAHDLRRAADTVRYLPPPQQPTATGKEAA